MTMKYRIREGIVTLANGRTGRRFLAERWVKLPFGLGLWWHVIDGDWRPMEHQAKCDIEHDMRLRFPLMTPKYYELPEGYAEKGLPPEVPSGD